MEISFHTNMIYPLFEELSHFVDSRNSGEKRSQWLSKNLSTDIRYSERLPRFILMDFPANSLAEVLVELGISFIRDEDHVRQYPFVEAWRSDSWRDCHASSGWSCQSGRRPIYGRSDVYYWVRSRITFPGVSSAGPALSVAAVTFPRPTLAKHYRSLP